MTPTGVSLRRQGKNHYALADDNPCFYHSFSTRKPSLDKFWSFDSPKSSLSSRDLRRFTSNERWKRAHRKWTSRKRTPANLVSARRERWREASRRHCARQGGVGVICASIFCTSVKAGEDWSNSKIWIYMRRCTMRSTWPSAIFAKLYHFPISRAAVSSPGSLRLPRSRDGRRGEAVQSFSFSTCSVNT